MSNTLSGVGGAKKLPKLTNEKWVLPCADLAEKQALWDYAASKGVPMLAGPIHYQAHGGTAYREDDDLGLAWYSTEHPTYPSGIMSVEPDRTMPKKVTPADFKAMCDAYAAR